MRVERVVYVYNPIMPAGPIMTPDTGYSTGNSHLGT